MMKYTITRQNNHLLLAVSGDLIGEESGEEILRSVEEQLAGNKPNLIVDISEVRYINSSGLAILITLLTKVRNRGGELFLVNPSESVKKLLIITKLQAIFKVYDTVAGATAHLAS